MYNYGSLIDVPIVDETINERSYEEDIVSNEKERRQEVTTSVAADRRGRRQDAFASLTTHMHYRFNSVDSRLENIESMLSEFLQKTRGI